MTSRVSPRSSPVSPAAEHSIALCGAGVIAGVHALAARSMGVRLAAVASRTRERAAKRAAIDPQARVVGYHELPAGADVVVVCTPPAQHCEDALRAVGAGATVLVEKPLTRTLAEADRLVDAGGSIVYAENLLFAPVVRTLLQRVTTMGPLTHVEVRTLQSAPQWGGFLDPEWGGGVLFDLGIHPLAIAVAIGRVTGNGEVVAAEARLSGTTTDTDAEVVLVFASGFRARVIASWEGPIDGVWDVQVASATSVVRVELRPAVALHVDGEPVALDPPRSEVPFVEEFGYEEQLSAAVAASRDGSLPMSDADFGRWMLEIVSACYVSAGRAGETIPVPSGCERRRTPWQLWREP
mgnify:CR=1 FL=1